jgi:hypothetical protein
MIHRLARGAPRSWRVTPEAESVLPGLEARRPGRGEAVVLTGASPGVGRTATSDSLGTQPRALGEWESRPQAE